MSRSWEPVLLRLVREVHVKADMVEQYEAARRQVVAYDQEHENPFIVRASASIAPVYRYATPLRVGLVASGQLTVDGQVGICATASRRIQNRY